MSKESMQELERLLGEYVHMNDGNSSMTIAAARKDLRINIQNY